MLRATPGDLVRAAGKGVTERGVCKSGRDRSYDRTFLHVGAKERGACRLRLLRLSKHDIYYHIDTLVVKEKVCFRLAGRPRSTLSIGAPGIEGPLLVRRRQSEGSVGPLVR